MNRENAAAFLPIIKAYAEGRTIQFRYNPLAHWENVVNGCNFLSSPECYRIKPEPREWEGQIVDTNWNLDGIAEFTFRFRGDIKDLPRIAETIRVREILD